MMVPNLSICDPLRSLFLQPVPPKWFELSEDSSGNGCKKDQDVCFLKILKAMVQSMARRHVL